MLARAIDIFTGESTFIEVSDLDFMVTNKDTIVELVEDHDFVPYFGNSEWTHVAQTVGA
jgi:poly-D-alanine transfer protein DltD